MAANTIRIARSMVTAVMLTVMLTPATAYTKRKHRQASKVSVPAGYASSYVVLDEHGRATDIATQTGKVVFINFWALSCVPCRAEMPSVNKLREHFRNDTNMLFICVDLDRDLVNSTAYMKEKGFGLTVYTSSSAVPEAFFHGLIPTTVVIDKKGKIALVHEGEDQYDTPEFTARMDELAKQ